ncbi:MAG: hypothetical protein ACKOW1_04950 [Novosphingobium sp.]
MPNPLASLLQYLRDRERSGALVLALVVEALLVLAVLSIGLYDPPKPPRAAALVSLNVAAPSRPKADQPKPAAAAPKSASPTQSPPVPVVAPVMPQPPVMPVDPIPRAPEAVPAPPRQPAIVAVIRPGKFGPADNGVPGDSKQVGSAPNGQPMYAAAWYREPYDSEMSGYLSTADGPGWALIACRTAPDYRVEGCVGLGEYPQGSRIENAVLAAAWQFKVRPPRVGGVSKIGAWVRIRIDYSLRPLRP